jgi:hypothetical protein
MHYIRRLHVLHWNINNFQGRANRFLVGGGGVYSKIWAPSYSKKGCLNKKMCFRKTKSSQNLSTLVIYLQAKIWQLGLRNAVIQSFFKLALYSFNVAAHNCALRLIISSVFKICIITKLVHNISSILRIVKNKNIFKYFRLPWPQGN